MQLRQLPYLNAKSLVHKTGKSSSLPKTTKQRLYKTASIAAVCHLQIEFPILRFSVPVLLLPFVSRYIFQSFHKTFFGLSRDWISTLP